MFSKLKSSIASMAENKAVTIPISASTLNSILENYQLEAINEANVAIQDGLIIVTGTTSIKKWGFEKELNFTLNLKPVSAEKRTLQLELVSLKPVDFNKINNKLLQRPPVITYENRLINVDLNAIEVVKKIPIGNIKSFAVEDGKLLVSVGV
ncbi:MAG: hypothetical protein ABS949_09460 [Solibacillus sp.]